MADQPKFENSLFHDLGSHLANAYQQFLDSRSQYGQQQEAQGGGTNALPEAPAPAPASVQEVQVPNSPMPETEQQPAAAQPMMQQPQLPTPQEASTSIDKQGRQANQAANQVANVAQDVDQKEQGIFNQGLQRQQELMDATYKSFQENHAKDQALMQAYQSNQIDPNHVINSMTTGGKIMASLGLIFSGLGSGATGQRNMAMDVINNAIQRDLEAQKANSNISYNAYQMHREGTQDEMSADIQHQKDNMLAINAAIEQQAARMKSPQAVLAARQTQLAISGQVMELNQKQAMIDAMKKATSNPAGDIPGRLRQMQLSGLLSPQQSEQALKEYGTIKNSEDINKNAIDSFNQVAKLQTVGSRVANPIQSKSQIDALWNPVIDKVVKDTAGRVTPISYEMISKLKPNISDSAQTVEIKRQKFINLVEGGKKQSPILQSLGLSEPTSQQREAPVKGKDGRMYVKSSDGKYMVPVNQ